MTALELDVYPDGLQVTRLLFVSHEFSLAINRHRKRDSAWKPTSSAFSLIITFASCTLRSSVSSVLWSRRLRIRTFRGYNDKRMKTHQGVRGGSGQIRQIHLRPRVSPPWTGAKAANIIWCETLALQWVTSKCCSLTERANVPAAAQH